MNQYFLFISLFLSFVLYPSITYFYVCNDLMIILLVNVKHPCKQLLSSIFGLATVLSRSLEVVDYVYHRCQGETTPYRHQSIQYIHNHYLLSLAPTALLYNFRQSINHSSNEFFPMMWRWPIRSSLKWRTWSLSRIVIRLEAIFSPNPQDNHTFHNSPWT